MYLHLHNRISDQNLASIYQPSSGYITHKCKYLRGKMELMYFLKSVVCWLPFLKRVCVHRLTWNILMPLYLNDIEKDSLFTALLHAPIYMQTNTSDTPTTPSTDTTKTVNMQIKNTWKQSSNLPCSKNVTLIVVSFISLFFLLHKISSLLFLLISVEKDGSSQWPADI